MTSGFASNVDYISTWTRYQWRRIVLSGVYLIKKIIRYVNSIWKNIEKVQIVVSNAGRGVSESLNNETADGIHDMMLCPLKTNSSIRHDAWYIVGELIYLEFHGKYVLLYNSIYRGFFIGETMGTNE